MSEKDQITLRNIRDALRWLKEASRAIQSGKYLVVANAVENATHKLSFLADFVAHPSKETIND